MAEERRVRICNARGLHARAAAKFVSMVHSFDAVVTVRRDSETVDAGSIMDLLMLAAGPGTQIDIRAEGVDAKAAVEALSQLVALGFHEDVASASTD